MTPSNFDYAAKWVCQRQNFTMQTQVPEIDISQALSTLHRLAGQCRAAVMIPDLFPSSRLETIYIPPENCDILSPSDSNKFVGDSRVTVPALSAIGAALIAEFDRVGKDMVLYEFPEGSQAIAYLPEMRDVVLQATGLVLLNN
jgi:hypothetical protein